MRRPMTIILNCDGFPLSEFRKITRREISIAKMFNGCAAIVDFNVYILNAPWWIHMLKMVVAKRHLSKIHLVKNREVPDFLEEVGPGLVPIELGGNLDVDRCWRKQLLKWEIK